MDAGTYQALYEEANDMINDEVFVGPYGERLLEMYNDRKDKSARYLLYDIVDEMVASAHEGALREMKEVLKRRSDELIEEIESDEG